MAKIISKKLKRKTKSLKKADEKVSNKEKSLFAQFSFKKPFGYYIGNLLIAVSVLIFISAYYPLVFLLIPTSPKVVSAETASSGFFINIPKIAASAPIIDQVDPWDKIEYKKALKNGVALAKGFSQPGEPGVVYLFAHSSDMPWNISRYNTIFLKLNQLNTGDVVEIYQQGKIYKYQVYDKKEVWPNQLEYLKTEDKGEVLILQTCTPIGTSLKRLLVYAKPV